VKDDASLVWTFLRARRNSGANNHSHSEVAAAGCLVPPQLPEHETAIALSIPAKFAALERPHCLFSLDTPNRYIPRNSLNHEYYTSTWGNPAYVDATNRGVSKLTRAVDDHFDPPCAVRRQQESRYPPVHT
jgi:hypothetical protein